MVLLVTFANFYSVSDISHQAIRLHLQFIGSSIYEYHSRTGQWPPVSKTWQRLPCLGKAHTGK